MRLDLHATRRRLTGAGAAVKKMPRLREAFQYRRPVLTLRMNRFAIAKQAALIPVNESGTDPRFISVLFVSALGARMVDLANDKLSVLRAEIEQQRNTIDTLRRGGHDCPDAERQLARMLAELRLKEPGQGSA